MSPQRKSRKYTDATQCNSLLSKVRYPSVTGCSLSLSIAFKQLFFCIFISPKRATLCLTLAQPLFLSLSSPLSLFLPLSPCRENLAPKETLVRRATG